MFRKVFLLTTFLVLCLAPTAFAFTAPTEASLWYQFYDTFYNDILAGPLGFVATGLLFLFCLYCAVKGNFVIAAITVCSATCVIVLKDVVISTGYCLL